MKFLNLLILVLAILFAGFEAFAETLAESAAVKEQNTVVISANAEMGFVAVLYHKIQFAKSDNYFNYRTDGGQDVLFSNYRFTVDMDINTRHSIVFLYQPLEISTLVSPKANVIMDGTTFNTGEGLHLLYRFPFYRASYLYNFASNPLHEIAIGASMQIRNATIEFATPDGKKVVSERNVGPVPLLKFRGCYGFSNGFWLGVEIDGIYAPISYLNGSNNETVGALLDASLRGGYRINKNINTYLNVRYIGGGATNSDPDNYARNWLQLAVCSLGATLSL